MSLDRRQLLAASGAAAGTALLPAGTVFAAPVSAAPRKTIAIGDDRYAEGRRFLAACEAAGVEVLPARADVAALWYGRLGQRVVAADIRLVGLTTYADFHVLEGCAAEARRGVAFAIGHDVGGPALAHTLKVDGDGAPPLDHLARSGEAWVEALAARLSGGRPATPCPKQLAASRPAALWSWAIA